MSGVRLGRTSLPLPFRWMVVVMVVVVVVVVVAVVAAAALQRRWGCGTGLPGALGPALGANLWLEATA